MHMRMLSTIDFSSCLGRYFRLPVQGLCSSFALATQWLYSACTHVEAPSGGKPQSAALAGPFVQTMTIHTANGFDHVTGQS